MSTYMVFAIGLLAQILFSARLLVQWIASERAHKILSPVLFWQLSMVASFMLCVYGWLRNDFAIILGQLIAYYVYIWNLNAKNSWSGIPRLFRILFIGVPAAAVVYFLTQWESTSSKLFEQEAIPMWLMFFGITGQCTFSLRFVYQWLYSRKAGESLLPITFWVISLAGSAMIIAYAVIRHDPVLIIGQATGFVVYLRNIMIGVKSAPEEASELESSQTAGSGV